MIIKAGHTPLIGGNQLRLNGREPVSWNIQRSITRRRDHRLGAAAVTVIVGFPWRALLLYMMAQFSLKPPLSQSFLQLARQSRFA